MQAPPPLSHGVRFQTPQSLPISSITAGNHQINRVAAHTKVPYPLTPHQPQSQTLILIPSTSLRSVPITVSKAPAQMKYRPSRLLLPSRPINEVSSHTPRNAKHYPRHRACLDSAPDDVPEQCYGRSICTDPFNPSVTMLVPALRMREPVHEPREIPVLPQPDHEMLRATLFEQDRTCMGSHSGCTNPTFSSSHAIIELYK